MKEADGVFFADEVCIGKGQEVVIYIHATYKRMPTL